MSAVFAISGAEACNRIRNWPSVTALLLAGSLERIAFTRSLWTALREVFATTQEQRRCRVHKNIRPIVGACLMTT